MNFIALLRSPIRLVRRLRDDRRGNVLMLMGFSVIPLTLATGISIDYAQASRLQTKLNSAADAAALAAVTQPMMLQNNATARTAAINMFNSQVTGQTGLIWNAADLTVTVTGNTTATSTRTAVVSYTAQSRNTFGGLVGLTTIAIGGRASAIATAAPNIDFYLALDTSPSMALPTTSAGIAKMDAAQSCSFACHSNKFQNYVGSKPKSLIHDNATFTLVKGDFGTSGTGTNKKIIIDADGSFIYENRAATDSKCKPTGTKDICVYNADGTYADSYWWAVNQGMRLRVTDERIAARDLMTLAQSYAAANSRTYRAALYTFDHTTNLKTIATLSSDLAAVGSAADAVELVTVNDQKGNGCPPGNSCSGNYLFTSFKSVLTKMLAEMPIASGRGTNDPGDTPQAFLFMVTDGMSDEDIGSGRTRSAMRDEQITQCNTIKNRGIQIAILYTEYTVESIQDDEPGQRAIATAAIPNIAPKLRACASPNLMYTVKTDESISDALKALFDKAVQSARLSQ